MPLPYPTIFANGCRQDECEIFALSQRVRMYPSIFAGALTWVRGFIDGDSLDVVHGYLVKNGSVFQISLAYLAMVRSLENLPDAARFRITLRVHAGWSAYNSPSR
jgi:hypothetical protein